MSDVVGVAELHFFRAKLLGIRTRSEILQFACKFGVSVAILVR